MEGKALVIKSAGSTYTVRASGSVDMDCKLVGKYRLEELRSTNPVVVGDWVEFTLEKGEKLGRITGVDSRKNYIIRKSTNLSKSHQIIASNIDLLMLMVTVSHPVTFPEFIDRYLVSAEAYNIPAVLLINKVDLYGDKENETLENWKNIYGKIGYNCIECSVTESINIDSIRDMLKGKVTLMAGNSGVGKSTLINVIEPGLKLRTSELSDYHKSGKHTTTFAEMFELEVGGYIIDTPGIRGFGITDMEDEPLFHYFPEFFRISAQCKYNNCIHVNEPDCAVIQAIESGELSISRYNSYLNLLEEQKNSSKYR
ncbi:MAG TPA: ribosome small subunit-dependent GTPase A [Bacteroides sp.]|nr:ribosome small subunit-dependent GTPase A [Bacteroides sp.]